MHTPSLSSARTHEQRSLAALRGVYRHRHKIDGAAIWYAMNERGQIIGVRAVGQDESEAVAVADLSELAYGSVVCRPMLTLYRDGVSPPRVSAATLLRLARVQPAPSRAGSPA
jgi:hypothetical protein